jgi:GTP cyclohydrolase IIa
VVIERVTTKQVQLTIIQIDNYGPWTNTLGNDREHQLQILQSNLYALLQESFAAKNGLVFFNRFDEMLAVTNGITEEEHLEIQKQVRDQFPISVSMGVGVAETPFEAQMKASKLLQKAGSAQSTDRRNVLACTRTLSLTEAYVQVIHVDVDGITRKMTDQASAFETSLNVMSVYTDLMRLFKQHGALLFFVGGDNFMGLANGVSVDLISTLLQGYMSENLQLKCGVGIASTGRKAAELATRNLELIRNERTNFILSTSS